MSTEEQREEEEPLLLLSVEGAEQRWWAVLGCPLAAKTADGGLLSGEESMGSHLESGPRSSSMRMSSRLTIAEYFRSSTLLSWTREKRVCEYVCEGFKTV